MCCRLWYVLCTWLVCLDLRSKLPSHDHRGDLCYDVLPHQRRHVIGNPRPPPNCSTRSSREPEKSRCSQNRTWAGCWTQFDTGQIGEDASWGGDLPTETSEQERVPLPPPLLVAQFPHIPMTPFAVGLYEMPTLGVPMGAPLSRQSTETVCHRWDFRCSGIGWTI